VVKRVPDKQKEFQTKRVPEREKNTTTFIVGRVSYTFFKKAILYNTLKW